MTDFPDYMTRDIPGQTTDVAPQYQTLFALNDECSVPHNSYTYWTYDFPDDGYVYKMDMMFLVIETDVDFTVKCQLSGVEFAIDSQNRTVYFPLWANPALVGCYNDQLKIRLWQGSGSTRPVLIRITGIKYKLPTDPYKTPVVEFSGTPTSGAAPLTVDFTDESKQFPTSWHWKVLADQTLEDYTDIGDLSFTDMGIPTTTDGIMTFTSASADPYYTKTITIDTNDYKKFSIRMKIDSGGSMTGQLFWNRGFGFREQDNASFTVYGDGEWHTYEIDLTDDPDWTGTVTQMRHDPFAGNGITAHVDYWTATGREYTTQNPQHVYSTVGAHDVTLTASNAVGSNYSTKYSYITVS